MVRISSPPMPRVVKRRRADANARRIDRLPLVEGDHVFVDRNAATVQRLLGLTAGRAQRGNVGQDQVVVGAAADELHAAGQKHLGQRLGIVHDLLRCTCL